MDKEERKKQIRDLVEKYYMQYSFLQNRSFESLVEIAYNMFLDTDLSIEEIEVKILDIIKDRIEKKESRYQEDNVRENHALIFHKLEEILPLLQQEGIDYYLGGALGGYLKYGAESDRCHDDLDFMVNEADLEKFQKICEQLGYTYSDHRMYSSRVLLNGIPSGDHEIMATSGDSDFHIGVFCFERLADGTIILKGYYHNEMNQPCCRQEIISDQLAREIFEKNSVDFRGQPMSIIAPEFLYGMKKYTNSEKDQHDIAFLDDKIDREKLERIQRMNQTERYIEYKPVEQVTNPELEEIFTPGKEEKEEEKKEEKEKPNILVKKMYPVQSDNGCAHRYIIIVSILMTVVVALIVLLLLKWFQII